MAVTQRQNSNVKDVIEIMEVKRVWKKSKQKAERMNTVAGKHWL